MCTPAETWQFRALTDSLAAPPRSLSLRIGRISGGLRGNSKRKKKIRGTFGLSTHNMVTVDPREWVLAEDFYSNTTFVVAPLHNLGYSNKARF